MSVPVITFRCPCSLCSTVRSERGSNSQDVSVLVATRSGEGFLNIGLSFVLVTQEQVGRSVRRQDGEGSARWQLEQFLVVVV